VTAINKTSINFTQHIHVTVATLLHHKQFLYYRILQV